jgi:hypothetical protein
MSVLTWDGTGQRFFETGLDRGVLYLEDGSGVAWHGLTAVDERTIGAQTSPVYWDGVKIDDVVSVGDFSATLKAITYPDEFSEYEGVVESTNGLFVTGQMPGFFGLSWRTKVGNDVNALLGYKIHVATNLIAVPTQKSHRTQTNNPDMEEFEWTLTSIPSRVPGYKPTAHLIFETAKSTPEFVTLLEEMLYGSVSTNAYLPSLGDLVSLASASLA